MATEGTPAEPSEPCPLKCGTTELFAPCTPPGGGCCALTISADKGVWTHEQAMNLTWYHNSTYCTADTFRLAASSWEAACGVKFIQVFDPSKAVFQVVDAGENEEQDKRLANVIAFAFFPKDLPPHRVVCMALMTQSPKMAVAVLRHELGHVLGWRHEHMWENSEELAAKLRFSDGSRELSDANCYQLTEYDRVSIMNYLKLWQDSAAGIVTDLSANDILGSRIVYPKKS